MSNIPKQHVYLRWVGQRQLGTMADADNRAVIDGKTYVALDANTDDWCAQCAGNTNWDLCNRLPCCTAAFRRDGRDVAWVAVGCEYCRETRGSRAQCCAVRNPERPHYRCTRLPGHDGPHVACCDGSCQDATWVEVGHG